MTKRITITVETELPICKIKKDIEKSPDSEARYKIEDIRKMMGPMFGTVGDLDIYWSLRRALNEEGIMVNAGRTEDNDKLLIFKLREEKIMAKNKLEDKD